MCQDHAIPRRADIADQRCFQCGCDANHACVDRELRPCSWATRNLCSHCANNVPAFRPGMRLYEAADVGNPGDETLPVLVRRSRMGQDAGGPFVEADLAEPLRLRAELVGTRTRANDIAAAILADCFEDDQLAQELHELFAMDVVRALAGFPGWQINELQLREWTEANRIPY